MIAKIHEVLKIILFFFIKKISIDKFQGKFHLEDPTGIVEMDLKEAVSMIIII